MNPLVGILFMAIGLFSMVASYQEWDFFMNHHKARFLIAIIGRTGARVFYGLLGGALFVFGLLFLLGLIK